LDFKTNLKEYIEMKVVGDTAFVEAADFSLELYIEYSHNNEET
jgi:hypothetical protein